MTATNLDRYRREDAAKARGEAGYQERGERQPIRPSQTKGGSTPPVPGRDRVPTKS